MRSIDLFRSRSYRMQPVGTVTRGAEWVLRSLVGSTTTYDVDFGPHRFKLELQSAKRGFGSAGIFILRRYYEPLLEFGHKLIDKGDRAIDGGANQGIYACAFAAAVGSVGQVYAFEPQPYAVACIQKNARLNSMTNITAFEGALSDVTGEIFLVMDHGPVAAFTSLQAQGENSTRVKSFAIDDLIGSGQMKDAQFMKLDVEGAELRALKGARSMVQRAKPRICVEAWDEKLYEEIKVLLSALGYKAYVFDGLGNLNDFSSFHPSPNVFFIV